MDWEHYPEQKETWTKKTAGSRTEEVKVGTKKVNEDNYRRLPRI
jgi:hypothetical protein